MQLIYYENYLFKLMHLSKAEEFPNIHDLSLVIHITIFIMTLDNLIPATAVFMFSNTMIVQVMELAMFSFGSKLKCFLMC